MALLLACLVTLVIVGTVAALSERYSLVIVMGTLLIVGAIWTWTTAASVLG